MPNRFDRGARQEPTGSSAGRTFSSKGPLQPPGNLRDWKKDDAVVL